MFYFAGKIILFYVTFISVMFGIFVLNLKFGTNYIKRNFKDRPVIDKGTLKQVINRMHPVIGVSPQLSPRSSNLIYYTTGKLHKSNNTKVSQNQDYTTYVKNIKKLLWSYKNAEQNKDEYVDCNVVKNSTKACLFSLKSMGPCGIEPYGYLEKRPCVYLKIDKIPNWQPEYYDENLPGDMPKSLKDVISKSKDKKKLWIHCSGHYPYDVEHLRPLTYYPNQGIMGYYFPYTDNDFYLAPLVAIKANKMKKGFLINVRCYLWAKNIDPDQRTIFSTTIRFYMGI